MEAFRMAVMCSVSAAAGTARREGSRRCRTWKPPREKPGVRTLTSTGKSAPSRRMRAFACRATGYAVMKSKTSKTWRRSEQTRRRHRRSDRWRSGVDPVERLSRSWRSWRFPRRSRRSSSRSALPSKSARRPSSRSVCFTHDWFLVLDARHLPFKAVRSPRNRGNSPAPLTRQLLQGYTLMRPPTPGPAPNRGNPVQRGPHRRERSRLPTSPLATRFSPPYARDLVG